MRNPMLCYSVGALLYCPANNEGIVNSLVGEKFKKNFSLALCLEDTIKDNKVEEAEQQLVSTIHTLYEKKKCLSFYMPKLFIRVRNPEQILKLFLLLKDSFSIVTGFILPKFCLENADSYINEIIKVNEHSSLPIYTMPIFENPSMIHLQARYDILYALKEKLDRIHEFVLNIRVGGNDLCHAFGFRRQSNETIYDIRPISNILSDIMTVYGRDYVISGPVWEYYSGEGWDLGLKKELALDKLNGFLGKTVIHPNQIPIVNESLSVSLTDYKDALSILHWDDNANNLVSSNSLGERMTEYKTHHNWAKKIITLHSLYGITPG